MDPQPFHVSEFVVLFRSGGTAFLLISMIGVLLTAIGILSLFKNIRPLALAGTVVALLVFVAAVFLLQASYTKFFDLATSGATADPNKLAETIVFSIAIDIYFNASAYKPSCTSIAEIFLLPLRFVKNSISTS